MYEGRGMEQEVQKTGIEFLFFSNGQTEGGNSKREIEGNRWEERKFGLGRVTRRLQVQQPKRAGWKEDFRLCQSIGEGREMDASMPSSVIPIHPLASRRGGGIVSGR